MTAYPAFSSSALVIAHPAHELRVLGWMGRARPLVSVLTSGSRSGDGRRRLERTAELVAAAGARRGALFGAVLDRDLYHAVMSAETDRFELWIETLARDFVRHKVELVVADGWQGYSAAHDLTHLMARLAAVRAARLLGRPVRVVEYVVAPLALTPLCAEPKRAFDIRLDAAEMAAKAAAVIDYPDIAEETAEIGLLEGEERAALERFFVPAPLGVLLRPREQLAHYERIGEQRVADGVYGAVLREAHLAAVIRALIAMSAEAAPAAAGMGLA